MLCSNRPPCHPDDIADASLLSPMPVERQCVVCHPDSIEQAPRRNDNRGTKPTEQRNGVFIDCAQCGNSYCSSCVAGLLSHIKTSGLIPQNAKNNDISVRALTSMSSMLRASCRKSIPAAPCCTFENLIDKAAKTTTTQLPIAPVVGNGEP